jgi:hypothetical protein
MKPKNEPYTIAVDFDGVLHMYTTPWESADIIPDPPVPGAIEWLRDMRKKFRVVIFTTRGKTLQGRQAVKEWLDKYGLEGEAPFDVVAEKPPALIYIDDRGYRFSGVFPTSDEIHRLRPWNKKKFTGGMDESPLWKSKEQLVIPGLIEHWRKLEPNELGDD